MTTKRRLSDNFKATVALKALRGDKTAQEIAAKHKNHLTQVTTRQRVRRYHLYSGPARISLSGGNHGLGHA